MKLQACHTCGMIHEIPELTGEQAAVCTRCQSTFPQGQNGQLASARTAALAAGAFFVFWPAVLLPIVEIERLGHRHSSSLLMGIWDLLQHGSWFVGLIVLLFSIIFPITKIILLLELSLLNLLRRPHKAWTYRLMEHVGRWSMMDVMLLAFLVMLVKLGTLVEFRLGPAVAAFVTCVALSMSASLCFDPHAIWDEESAS